MTAQLLLTYAMYCANILVAGWISISSLFYPKIAYRTVFQEQFVYSESIRLVGALWFAIFLLSLVGLWRPEPMRWVFLFQFIYKGSWLLFAALPAMQRGEPYPTGMASTFVVWVVILPFVIPWKTLWTG
ncbi:MAG: hypothetical protein AAGJ82_01345 [Bacteroidota bacterium]